ncbi:hypothetical protein ABDB91_08685 [Desulfoscipio sp. XC116]|uniref:hypothetical protein n=1 Tax=Desulfoscipio sp. XC116 TaxID=3144975 RepID=UPI00325B495F
MRVDSAKHTAKGKGVHREVKAWCYKGDFIKIPMTWWRNSASQFVNMALSSGWFDEIGLVSLVLYKVGILHHFREGVTGVYQ